MSKIIIVYGETCVGKSTFVFNNFLKDKTYSFFNKPIPPYVTSDYVIIGNYENFFKKNYSRYCGNDILSIRKYSIKLLFLIKKYKNLNIILEGEKVYRKVFLKELINKYRKNIEAILIKRSLLSILKKNKEILNKELYIKTLKRRIRLTKFFISQGVKVTEIENEIL